MPKVRGTTAAESRGGGPKRIMPYADACLEVRLRPPPLRGPSSCTALDQKAPTFESTVLAAAHAYACVGSKYSTPVVRPSAALSGALWAAQCMHVFQASLHRCLMVWHRITALRLRLRLCQLLRARPRQRLRLRQRCQLLTHCMHLSLNGRQRRYNVL